MKDNNWNLGIVNRVSLLRDPAMHATRPLTVSDVVRIHERAALTDVNAVFVYPLLRRLIGSSTGDSGSDAALTALDAWAADGTLRTDANNDGFIDHGGAIAIMDAWWPEIVTGLMRPYLGEKMLNDAATVHSNNLPDPNVVRRDHSRGASNTSGWAGFIAKQVKMLLGEPVARPLSRSYCGGSVQECRTFFIHTLRAAIAVASHNPGYDLGHDHTPDMAVASARNDFPSEGDAKPVASTPVQNRPTFEIVTNFR